MKKSALLTLFCLFLPACSSALDGQTQQITILTPGARDAECYLENPDFKYRAASDETLRIMKSEHDLTVHCIAPGNREKILTVPHYIEDHAAGNVVTAGAGLIYDHFSKALYAYPETVIVDFRDVPVRPYPLPQYHDPHLIPPSYADIEYYGPSVPMVEPDKYRVTEPVGRRHELMNPHSSNPFSDGFRADDGSFPDEGQGLVPIGPSFRPPLGPVEEPVVTPVIQSSPEQRPPMVPLPPGFKQLPPPSSAQEKSVSSQLPSSGEGLSAEDLTRFMNPAIFDSQ